MTLTATRLTTGFAARIDGVDIQRPIDEATWTEIRDAFDEHALRHDPGEHDGRRASSFATSPS